MSDELVGQTLGQYQIRLVLGKGGMSTVYLAYQPSMDRTVAIKVLPREFLHDDTFLARFKTEVRTIAQLEHLHILPVYDAGEDRGIPYIVMRYLSGGTLSDLVATRLPTLSTVTRIVEQVADALDYAHEREIVHRDLKPSNILLDSSGNAYLADFGIARVRQSSGLTGSQVVGTPPYVAPEMVQKDGIVTTSVDIYALATITYEMLTGVAPYEDPDPMKVLMAHVLEPVPSVREYDPTVSEEIDRVVQRGLAKTPQERYRTAGDFARELMRAAQVGVRPARPEPPGKRDTPPVRQKRVPTPPPADVEVAPEIHPHEAERVQPVRRRGGLGCLLVLGVIGAMLAAVVISAFVLTDGQPASLLGVLGGEEGLLTLFKPPVTYTPQPTVTLTPTRPSDAPTPVPGAGTPGGLSQGGRLAFASNRDGDYEIFLIDVDGSNLRQLTDNGWSDFDPAWSPDGKQIAYYSREGGDAEIFVMNADGTDVHRLTDNDTDDVAPDWSPDGEWIAFSSNRDGDFDIYLIQPNGSGLRPLTFNDLNDMSPSWSPDGTHISYYIKADSTYYSAISELYVIDVQGGTPTRLTNNETLDQWPDWSPDGLFLVYTSSYGVPVGERALFMLDISLSETGRVRLTTGPGHDDDPAWSPDGTRVAFDSDRYEASGFDIFVYHIVSGLLEQITTEAGNDVAPAWQPQE